MGQAPEMEPDPLLTSLEMRPRRLPFGVGLEAPHERAPGGVGGKKRGRVFTEAGEITSASCAGGCRRKSKKSRRRSGPARGA